VNQYRDLDGTLPPTTPRVKAVPSTPSYDGGTRYYFPPPTVGSTTEPLGYHLVPLHQDKITEDLTSQNDEAIRLDLMLYGQAFTDARTGLRLDPRNIVVRFLSSVAHSG